MNNNDFSSHTFTWALKDHSTAADTSKIVKSKPQEDQSQQQQQQAQEPFSLSDADLFQFLLGEEAQQAAMTDNHPVPLSYSVDEDSSTSEDVSMTEYKKPKETSKNNGPPASSTSRLDFRPINDYIPESQLKAMTSKERRQLRNKISARNFRNRRKEYIGTLEEELNQQKAENSQLKLELKWVRTKMERLQKENDKLRVDLVLGGMTVLPTPVTQVLQQQTSPYLLDSTSIINSTLNLSSSSSSDESTLSSPPNLFSEFPDGWDFVLPEENNNNTYLSHALVPHWNINQVLSKETSQVVTAPNLFQQYPLLAPALMSIVLTHTMTMSTDDILATAKLNPLPAATIQYNEKEPFASTTMMTDKEAKAVWDILEPLTLMNERNKKVLSLTKEEATKEEEAVTKSNDNNCLFECPSKNYVPFCPLGWLQTRICRYLCEFAANHCTTYGRQDEQEIEKKFILCRQFEKAKRYMTACQ